MADPITVRQLELSAVELRAMTKWPDALIEDYLAISGNVSSITNIINVVIEEQSMTQSTLEAFVSRLTGLTRFVHDLADQVSSASSLSSRLNVLRALVGDLAEDIGCARALEARVNTIGKRVSDIEEQLSVPGSNAALRSVERKLPAQIMARVVLGV